MLYPHLIHHARRRQAHELGEWRVRLHERQDSIGMGLDTAPSRWRSRVRKSIALVVRQPPHVSIFAENLYAELSSVRANGETASTGAFPGYSVTDSYDKPKINVVKAGINWRY